MDLRFFFARGKCVSSLFILSNPCYQYVLRKGSINFISCPCSKKKALKDITKILVVRKFQDVFPNKILSLPLQREFDFFY